jgi:hypothetical protein
LRAMNSRFRTTTTTHPTQRAPSVCFAFLQSPFTFPFTVSSRHRSAASRTQKDHRVCVFCVLWGVMQTCLHHHHTPHHTHTHFSSCAAWRADQLSQTIVLLVKRKRELLEGYMSLLPCIAPSHAKLLFAKRLSDHRKRRLWEGHSSPHPTGPPI